MNCRPGDLAVIVRNSQWLGWIVEVVAPAPRESFVSPDGFPFKGAINSDWLIKAPRPFGRRPYTQSCYAMVPDTALRPIRDPGDDARDEMLRPLPNQLEPA